jgi:hypothetical protein
MGRSILLPEANKSSLFSNSSVLINRRYVIDITSETIPSKSTALYFVVDSSYPKSTRAL